MGLFGQGKDTNRYNEFDETPEYEAEQSVTHEQNNKTVITKGITVTGKLKGEGAMHIEGVIEGEIELAGHITVDTTGMVKGPIQGDTITIAGRVEGNINSTTQLKLERTGTIIGDVVTPSFIVMDGGKFNGRSTMIKQHQMDEPETVTQVDNFTLDNEEEA